MVLLVDLCLRTFKVNSSVYMKHFESLEHGFINKKLEDGAQVMYIIVLA
jgi:hypothetical protein